MRSQGEHAVASGGSGSRTRWRPVGGRSSRDAGRDRFGYLLLAPQTLGLLLIGAVAIGGVIDLSLTKVNVLAGTRTFVGLDNYARIASDPDMAIILLNTFFFVGLLSVTGTIVSLGLALLLNQKLPGINIFRSAIFIPALITTVAWTLVWRFILQPAGLLDSITAMVDAGPFPWLRGGWLTLAVFVGIQLTKNVGINVMIFLAALQGIREDLVDAGRVDGAGRWATFRHVVLPQISPAILMVFMLMISGSFKVFELVLLLTNGGPGVQTTVLAFEIFRQAFRLNDIGYAAALSVLLFSLVLITSGIIWLFRRKLVFYESN